MESEVSDMFLKNYEDRLDFLNRHLDKTNRRLIGGGENGATICRISVIGDDVSVRSVD